MVVWSVFLGRGQARVREDQKKWYKTASGNPMPFLFYLIDNKSVCIFSFNICRWISNYTFFLSYYISSMFYCHSHLSYLPLCTAVYHSASTWTQEILVCQSLTIFLPGILYSPFVYVTVHMGHLVNHFQKFCAVCLTLRMVYCLLKFTYYNWPCLICSIEMN